MVRVILYAKTKAVSLVDDTKQMLNRIASQSRTRNPFIEHPREDLFEDTLKWGHDSIQEFIDYVFWIQGVSRVLLAQLTRHRMASYNVSSQRHVPPNECIIPEGITRAHGEMKLSSGPEPEDNVWLEWTTDNGVFEYHIYNDNGDHNLPLPDGTQLEDVRMLFPSAVTVNLFMKLNGRSLRNFLRLRLNKHAQWEIRELAEKIFDIVYDDCPELLEWVK